MLRYLRAIALQRVAMPVWPAPFGASPDSATTMSG